VKRLWREFTLAAIIAALMLAFTAQLRRGDQLPTPPGMVTFVAAPPPTTRCSAVGFPGTPPRKIVDVRPTSPGNDVRGTVVIQADVDERGYVRNARVVRSVPGLDQLALDAIVQWRFEPGMLRGEPQCVTMTLIVTFPPR
jgi:TonB family protein